MKISPLFLAIRAVSAEFARRLYVPVVWIVSIALLVVIALLIWAVTINGWWWLLLAPVILATLVFITLAIIARLIITLLRPAQTRTQHQEVRRFVDAIQKSSETIQTPKFIILFRLVKDMLSPNKQTFINEVSSTASSLRTGLKTIVDSFQSSSR